METGKHGEDIAAEYLHNHGYAILARNWHCAVGELDIVAQIGQILVFIEVRSRRGASTEAAFASITERKRQRFVDAIYAYIDAHDLPYDLHWRVDVIGVALPYSGKPQIDHVEDALGW